MGRVINEKLIRDIITENGIKVKSLDGEPCDAGRRIILDHCVFDPNHSGTSAAIIISKRGSISYTCQHDSCKQRKITDFVKLYKPNFFKDVQKTPSADGKPAIDPKSLLLTLDSVKEESAEWLIPERIPMKTITVIAGDGGSGKTTIWADLAAAVSSGNKPLLAGDIPKAFWEEEPAKVLYFSTEDSTKVVLKAKLRKAGANFANIATVDLSNIEHIKYDAPELAALFEIYKPKLCVFDPLQGYLDARLDMSRRNAIRQGCIAPLSALAEKYGTAIVIIAHSNKRSDAADRGRLADSADIWDGARSVIMVGRTADGLRYAAQEKSNYGPLAETILFTINGDGLASYYGNSSKHDRDFVNERTDQKRNAPARDDAREQLLEALRNAGGSMPAEALKEFANAASITASMLRRVKSDMRKEGLMDYEVEGNAGKGKGTRTIVKLIEQAERPEEELPELPYRPD